LASIIQIPERWTCEPESSDCVALDNRFGQHGVTNRIRAREQACTRKEQNFTSIVNERMRKKGDEARCIFGEACNVAVLPIEHASEVVI
jgi:hypothetical protein